MLANVQHGTNGFGFVTQSRCYLYAYDGCSSGITISITIYTGGINIRVTAHHRAGSRNFIGLSIDQILCVLSRCVTSLSFEISKFIFLFLVEGNKFLRLYNEEMKKNCKNRIPAFLFLDEERDMYIFQIV